MTTDATEHMPEGTELAGEPWPPMAPEDASQFEHLKDMPPPASIANLASDDRWNDVPVHLQMEDFHARGYNEIWRGRGDELDRMHNAFPERKGTAAKTTNGMLLLYGAQGAGKSSLITRFALEAEDAGMAAVILDQSAFHSEQQFIKQLMESAFWQRAVRLEKIKTYLKELSKRMAAGVAKRKLRPVLRQAGLEGALDDIGNVEYSIAAATMEKTTPKDVVEVLQRLDNGFAKGFVIAVDETQRWATQIGNSALTRIANLIGDPTIREAAKLRTGGLIMAGLTDTAATLEKLDITRPGFLRVSAMKPLDALQVLDDHLTRAEIEPKVKAVTQGRWREALAQEFFVWPHHTICAARAAVCVLQNASEDYQDHPNPNATWKDYEQDLEWARTIAAHGVSQLYDQRLGVAKKHPDDGIVPDIVGLAKATDNRIHVKSIRRLVDHYLERFTDERQSERETRISEHVEGLLHSGVLEPVLTKKHGQTNFLRMPIPSMATYAKETSLTIPNRELVEEAISVGKRTAGESSEQATDHDWFDD